MRYLVLGFCLLALAGCKNSSALTQWMHTGQSVATAAGYGDQAKAAEAVEKTLTTTSGLASAFLGKQGNFDIPLPDQIQSIAGVLSKYGFDKTVTRLKSKMNQAASEAAADAGPVFKNAITSMTIPDALGLINGGDTSVTDYFRKNTHDQLAAKMKPVVEQKLKATGFSNEYNSFLNVYKTLPISQKLDLDINDYVVNQTLDGMYNRMGKEEVAIRKDPKKAGSELLQKFLSGSDDK